MTPPQNPPSPVDLAAARRAADRRELDRAKEADDWGAAFDVLHANLHEIEGLTIRSLAKHDTTHDEIRGIRELVERTLECVGGIMIAVEKAPPAASYRPSRASASNLDAQALAQTIENVDRQHASSILAMGGRIGAIEAQIGSIPDATKGRKGSGIAEIVHRLDSRATVTKFALVAAIASAFGVNVPKFVEWLVHLR